MTGCPVLWASQVAASKCGSSCYFSAQGKGKSIGLEFHPLAWPGVAPGRSCQSAGVWLQSLQ